MDEIQIEDEGLKVITKITSMFIAVRGFDHKIAKGIHSKNESIYFGVGANYGIICMKDGEPRFVYLDNNRVRYLRMEGFEDDFIDNEAIGVWKEANSINQFVENLIKRNDPNQ